MIQLMCGELVWSGRKHLCHFARYYRDICWESWKKIMCYQSFDKIGCAGTKIQARYFLNINMSCSNINWLVYLSGSKVLGYWGDDESNKCDYGINENSFWLLWCRNCKDVVWQWKLRKRQNLSVAIFYWQNFELSVMVLKQGCTTPGCQATKFCAMVPNICGSSVANFSMSPCWQLEFWDGF